MRTTDIRPTTATYGCEHFGRLRRVLLHRPGEALGLVNARNYRRWLFDGVPDPARFAAEHDRYRALLEAHGVEVLELSDHLADYRERIRRLPNLSYLHDTAVVSSRGTFLSRMATAARRGEEDLVGEALAALGVPLTHRFDGPGDAFEGCLLLSPETLLVADTERHTAATIARFIPRALDHFREVIRVAVPQARRFMHPDMIYNRVDLDLALAYLPAFLSVELHTRNGGAREIDFRRHMAERGVEIVEVSGDEQRRWACSFVPLEPGVVVHYDLALEPETRRRLERRGVEFVLFHPEALLAGGGSLRCLTLRLHREPLRGGRRGRRA
jgi:arginine deiminase